MKVLMYSEAEHPKRYQSIQRSARTIACERSGGGCSL